MLPLLIVSLLVLVFGVFPTPSVWAGHGDPHTLTVSTTGTGGGTVTSTPPGITCPGECTEDYDDGTGVTLVALAASGSLFGGWGGACSGTGSCALTMDETKTVTARFTVERRAFFSPNRGRVGSLVTVTGDGFAASQVGIAVVFDAAEVVSVSADSVGSFTTSFIVPPRPAGSYAVTVGSVTNQNFTVTSFLSIGPSSGPPGTTVSLNGSGFGASATVSITFDGKTVRSISVDSQGSISTSIQVPVAPGGPRSVGVSDPSRGTTQSTFTVTPMLSLDRLNVSPGSSVTATGVGFAANETAITVTIDQTWVKTGISADTSGSWTTSLTVPSLPAGSHAARASGSLTSISRVPAVTLTLGAGLSLEPSSGSPGTALEVSGSGFGPRESITVTVGNGLTEIGVSANSQGAWTANITIPPAPGGRLTIRASGARSAPQETDFTVIPTVSLSQPTGYPGSSVTIEGHGFRSNQDGISIRFGADIVASPLANAQGSWTSTLTIPPSPAGAQSIIVSGGNPQLQVPFTVTPAISMAGTGGEPGAPITVMGSGFGANEKGITVTLDQTPVAAGISANAEGSWSVSFPLPSLPTGSYAVLGSGSQTSAISVPEITLTVGADLSLERSSGPPGTTLKVSGAGFRASESITLTVGQGLAETLAETRVAANDEGVWTATITQL